MASSVGEQLRNAREARGLTLMQVAQLTHVRVYYLEALENDQRSELPSAVQGRGFLRLYAGALDLPIQPLLDAWDGKAAAEPVTAPVKADINRPVERERPADEDLSADKELLAAEPLPQETAQPGMLLDEPLQNEPIFVSEKPVEDPPPYGQETPAGSSRAVFEEIGLLLRQQREALGLSRAEVERYTRLRQHYIQALEEGRLEGMPSPVQGKGMLSNYVAFLNLDEERILLRFAEGLQIRRVERIPKVETPLLANSKKRPARQASAWRRFLTPDLIFGVSLAAIILFFVVWTAARISSEGRAGVEPTPPGIAEILLATPSVTAGTALAEGGTVVAGETTGGDEPAGGDQLAGGDDPAGEDPAGLPGGDLPDEQATLPAEQVTADPEALSTLLPFVDDAQETAAVTATVPPAGRDPLQVYIVARQRAWLQVITDGKVAFQGRTVPGNAYAFSGTSRIEMQTGNAAALQVFFNQNDLGTLGSTGQVVGLVFLPEGMFTPTPAFTATPTVTPTATITPIPSPTLPATPTITPFVPQN